MVLFGGPAGSGKSTLARAWCATRARAVHIQLDEIRSLIVAGYADTQVAGDLQSEQFHLSVRACCVLAREFYDSGYDVAIDDVLFPGAAFDASWRSHLAGIEWRVVIIHPTLEETLARSSTRDKKVPDRLVREQHQATFGWPERATGSTPQDSRSQTLRPWSSPRWVNELSGSVPVP